MSYPADWLKVGERFVRTATETTTVEPRTADAGVLFVGVFGAPVNTTFGDLFVEYDLDLWLPQLV